VRFAHSRARCTCIYLLRSKTHGRFPQASSIASFHTRCTGFHVNSAKGYCNERGKQADVNKWRKLQCRLKSSHLTVLRFAMARHVATCDTIVQDWWRYSTLMALLCTFVLNERTQQGHQNRIAGFWSNKR
jgi:hypothetical protein